MGEASPVRWNEWACPPQGDWQIRTLGVRRSSKVEGIPRSGEVALIRLSKQERFAAVFFAVVVSFVWVGAFLGWFGEWLQTSDVKRSSPDATHVEMEAYSLVAVGDGSIQGTVNDVVAWEEGAARQDRPEVVRVEATSGGAGQRVVATGDCSGIAEGFPAEIAWRESRCTIGINTGNGYLGYAQIATFHWQGGLCSDLDWSELEQYNECVTRLWNGGAGASHWAAG